MTVKINFKLLIVERSPEDIYAISIKGLFKIQLLWKFEHSPYYQFKGEKDSFFIMEVCNVMSKRPRLSCYFVLGANITQAGIKLLQ